MSITPPQFDPHADIDAPHSPQQAWSDDWLTPAERKANPAHERATLARVTLIHDYQARHVSTPITPVPTTPAPMRRPRDAQHSRAYRRTRTTIRLLVLAIAGLAIVAGYVGALDFCAALS